MSAINTSKPSHPVKPLTPGTKAGTVVKHGKSNVLPGTVAHKTDVVENKQPVAPKKFQ